MINKQNFKTPASTILEPPNWTSRHFCWNAEYTFATPKLRSAKQAPANVRRLNKISDVIFYCSVGERSQALALLNAAQGCVQDRSGRVRSRSLLNFFITVIQKFVASILNACSPVFNLCRQFHVSFTSLVTCFTRVAYSNALQHYWWRVAAFCRVVGTDGYWTVGVL